MRIVLKPAGLAIVLLTIGILLFVAFTKKGTVVASTATPVATATPKSVAASPNRAQNNLAQNADMSAKDPNGSPSYWGTTWTGSGKIAVLYDETQFRSAPASLCLNTKGAPAHGQVAQYIAVSAGEKYTVGGYLRSEGSGTFSLAVNFCDATLRPLGFQHVGMVTTKPTWEYREAVVTIPQGASRLGILVFANANGKVWLDDVSVTKVL